MPGRQSKDEDTTSEEPKGIPKGIRWLIGVVIALLSAGGSIVALLTYFSRPTIEIFEASPQEVPAQESVTLKWKVAQGSSAVIEPGNEKVPLEGTENVRPESTTIYRLVARNRWGTSYAEQRIVVTQRPPDTVSVSSVYVSTNKDYRAVKGGLKEGAQAFLDRGYKWTGIPSALDGATYFITSEEDKCAPTFSLRFEADRASVVYVARNPGYENEPAWMAVFSKTPGSIVLTGSSADLTRGFPKQGVPYNLFRKDYPPGTIDVGPNISTSCMAEGIHGMYSIIVVAKK